MEARLFRSALGLFGCLLLSLVISPVIAQQEAAEPAAQSREDAAVDAALASSGDARRSAAPASDDANESIVCEPSQGRPIFITPGETFIFVMRLNASVTGDVTFFLSHAKEPEVRAPLKPTTPPSYSDDYCTLVLLVPQSTEPGLYNIEVRAKGGTFYSRHSVRVVDSFKKKFRFVHLSSMNIGDLTAPEFDDTLPPEVNLLAPEFIVATGDYTEWARVKDDASSWNRVLSYLEKFDAPVYMLCGAHDHEASFPRMVANKPIGVIDYGSYHGLLLLDHPGNPIEQDYNQIQWVETDLRRNRTKTFNFICTNSDELGLLDVWRETGDLAKFVKDYKVRLIVAGGATDWDFKEFASKLAGVEGLDYVRTHEASTCLRDRATGISHYRVIEVDGDRLAYTYPDDGAVEKLQHSIAAGRLRAFYKGKNDGSTEESVVTIQNALNQSFADARVWLRVAKRGKAEPSVAGGRLIRALDVGSYWSCEVAVDLPDKGAVRVAAASDDLQLPPALPVDVALEGPSDWPFELVSTDFGLAYFKSSASPVLKLTNRSDIKLTLWPVIRVNGQHIHPDAKACPRLPITLEPGKTLDLPLALQVRKVSPGPHKLQVYFLEDELARATYFDVVLSRGGKVAVSDAESAN